MNRPKWRTSSYSTNGGNCVEVGRADPKVLVRDTKDRQGGTLEVPGSSWAAFTVKLATRL
jgi:hypothetical protein